MKGKPASAFLIMSLTDTSGSGSWDLDLLDLGRMGEWQNSMGKEKETLDHSQIRIPSDLRSIVFLIKEL